MSLGYRDKILWAAGLLEGEGCFRVTNSYKGTGTKHGRTHQVQASQKAVEPLERLKAIFGGSIYKHPKRPIHQWMLVCVNARGAMMMLYPFVSAFRKEQIKTALASDQKWCAGRRHSH